MHVRGSQCHFPLRQHGLRSGRRPRRQPRVWGTDLERGPGTGSGQRLALHSGGSVAGCAAVALGPTLTFHQPVPHE